jgi:ribosomal protein L10
MKKTLALILIISCIFTACSPQNTVAGQSSSGTENQPVLQNQETNYSGLSDPALLQYVEDNVYSNLIDQFVDDAFFVENVSAIWVSEEYLDELAYNSQENIYFGYSLSELEDFFQGTTFIFTLGEDGQTAVQEFENYDDTYDKVVRNVAIGAGVILLCVTVSVVTAGVGAPVAVSVIFAASAKSATIFALSSGALGGVTAGVVTGIQTKDFDEAKKAAALAASEGFMWGALSGAVVGGVGSAVVLKGATLNGLTMNQAAAIQRESKWSLDTIKSIKSIEEYNVYKAEDLVEKTINGTKVLIPSNIDLNSSWEGLTNLERLKSGLNVVDEAGIPFEWHHIGQKADAPLALLTSEAHRKNAGILNQVGKESEIDRYAFAQTKKALNAALAELIG